MASLFQGFGSTPAASTGSSLFGASTATSTPAASAPLYPNLTTSTATSTPATTSTSLFGTTPAPAPTPAPGTSTLFSTSNSQAASATLLNAAGRSTLNASSTTPVPLTPDTIALSTKYTELPADAKGALDQFHTFLQTQIHLSSALTSRSSDSLDKISKDTDELSKRLATLKDALDRDSKAVQALQDRVGQELKQAESAGRIIEAYGNTSQANFLYAGNNSAGQYFEEQCPTFESQLRQFRTTIEDIERHLASFNTRNPHVAHALTEVLRNQHNGFLAVAGQVALLHDEIKSKEKAYLMFRRKYFDDDADPFQAATKHHKTNNMHSSPMEGQQSFREFAKQSLRPASTVAPVPAQGLGASTTPFGASTLSSSLKPGGFGVTAMPTSTPAFSLTAPTTSSAGPGLFGAPAAPASTGLFGAPASTGTSLFGAPAASAGTSLFGAPATGTGLFGAPAASTATPFGAFKK
ncbi:Nucleoporin p58/p45 [Podila minutissima]|uniref:Nucleoporin p58/p45 n=1 Tax=Podila minutissima TaxID=64525 RepID=A0A9P5VQ54_9FUNG|nr:Nucleoporin p58/p45 [Podila minutissima]